MSNSEKNVLIINGTNLARTGDPLPNRFNPNYNEEDKYKRDITEAQSLLRMKLSEMKKDVNELPGEYKLSNEIFFKIDYPSIFLAKSFQVKSVYNIANLTVVGSSSWKDEEGEEGKSDYISGTVEQIKLFENIIENPEAQIREQEIRRMDNIELIKPFFLENKVLVNEIGNDFFELLFHSIKDSSKGELISNFEKLLSVNSNDYDLKWLDNNVLCVNIRLSDPQIQRLLSFNPLRSMNELENRDFSSMDTSFQISHNNKEIILLNEEEKNQLPWVGIIDGGVKVNEKAFSTVEELYHVDSDSSDKFIEHGSSVASIMLYGDLNDNEETKVSPEFRVASIRALPSKKDIEFNLISLEKIIEEVIPLYPSIKIWNLSIGPKGPIQDEIISSLTRLLDKLAYEKDILFVIAAGNTGNEQGIGRRIQIPGDSVNNITVASYYNDHLEKQSSHYNSIGPGREGAKLKPDIRDHGGVLPIDPIYTFSSFEYAQNKVAGTSFAAPLVARKLAKILTVYPEFTTLQARTLLEHSLTVSIEKDREISIMSKGEIDEGEALIFSNSKTEVKIMYSGTISAKGIVILPIPLPDNYNSKMVDFSWSLGTKTPTNPDYPDQYTVYCIEDDFFPNAYKSIFRDKTRNVDIVLDLSDKDQQDESEILLAQGYKKLDYPDKKEGPKYIKEGERKKDLLKWDTIKNQRVSKRATSLNEPFIRLHGLSRTDSRERISYVLVVTVKLKDDLDIQNSILQKYKQLQEINIDTRIQANV